jgi:uncharacterized phage infection (PIP) family protein YhgE
MGRVLALLVSILLALASGAGYLFLSGKITAGKKQMAEGQGTFEKGQTALEKGKVQLEAGKQELAEGKKEYRDAKDNRLLVLLDDLLTDGKGFKEAEKKIAEGDKQVAQGEDKVQAGEKRLDAGERELSQGRDQLGLARGARIACALGAVIFTLLSLVLGFRWRRALARTLKFTHG